MDDADWSARRREAELALLMQAANERIGLLEAQVGVYMDDFGKERRDRERAHATIARLESQLDSLLRDQHLQVTCRVISRAGQVR